jgi:D-3-phosphoglycerate dehydrogenase / 2-oxoglutarate reductase
VKVLITCRQMQACIEDFRARFDERGIELAMPAVVQQPTEDELIGLLGDVDGMIAGDDPLSARVLAHAGRLRIISKWGVGTDGIDFEAARERGIAVTNTPGVFGDEVADVAAAYMVMLARQLHRIDASVRDGGWLKHEGRSLTGLTLGVAGLGSIGRATARRGHGFGMRVIGHDLQAPEDAAGVEIVDREALFGRSDVLVLCLPLTPATRHIVDRDTLALMRPGSLLVNVARGPLVDEAALVEALESGRVAAAALDVFESEPLARDHPLRRFEQCVFGSHNGSNTREGVLRASERAVEHLLAGLERAA